jgi:hypothetical protein
LELAESLICWEEEDVPEGKRKVCEEEPVHAEMASGLEFAAFAGAVRQDVSARES